MKLLVPPDALPAVAEALKRLMLPYELAGFEPDGALVLLQARVDDNLVEQLRQAGAMVQP